MSPEDVPVAVFPLQSTVITGLEEIDIAWDTEALQSVIEVNIVVRGYRESNGQIEFSGTEITLAENVDYQNGSLSNITSYSANDLVFDVGVIGVFDAQGYIRYWSRRQVTEYNVLCS